ncbi:MAG TPA: DUF4238 domain-containing protein [Blastocatellia bacterium]|nr:DUF4238 domain-containing protein [Blastocatellia bacterium]
MAQHKRQHYVPQSYLKRFTQDDKRLYVYDKVLRQSLGLISVKDIAQESYFYDIPLDAIPKDIPGINRDPHLEEEGLKAIDDEFKKIIDVAIGVAKGGGADLKQRAVMSFCLAVQLMRTLDFRNVLVRAMEKLTEATLNSVLELADPKLASQLRVEAKKYDKGGASVLHNHHLWNPENMSRIAKVLYNRIWLLGVNTSPIPLYTSDAPVALWAHKEMEPYTPKPDTGPAFSKAIDMVIESDRPGLETEGVEVYFPLNPHCALIILENEHFKNLQEWQGKRIPLNLAAVEAYNKLQVLESHRQVYSISDDFGLAEKTCAEHPEKCASDRERVKIEFWKWNTQS